MGVLYDRKRSFFTYKKRPVQPLKFEFPLAHATTVNIKNNPYPLR